MKSAITHAVTTFAQAAGAWNDRDTATIGALRREVHRLANRLTVSEGALELLATKLELPAGTSPAEVVAEAMRRLG